MPPLLQFSIAVYLQAKLLAEVNAMLSSFAEQKAAAVASAVAGMHGVLAQDRTSTEASFNALSQATSSAIDAIKASAESRILCVTSCVMPDRIHAD